jgi:hypothetical protein
MLNASDDDDLVEFAATARVFMERNIAMKAGSFHDANAAQGPKLDPGDTTELGELLAFLSEWLAGPEAGQLEDSLRRHVGTDATTSPHYARRKRAVVANTAVAHELAGWCWSLAVLDG